MLSKVNLIAVPSFVDNLIVPGVLATFDSIGDRIKLFCKVDKDVESEQEQKKNVFQRFMTHTNLPNLLTTKDVFDYNVNYKFDSAAEYHKRIEVLEKNLTDYLSSTNLSKLPDYHFKGHELFQSHDEDSIDGCCCGKEPATIMDKIDSINGATNSVMCVQYLSLLMQFFAVEKIEMLGNAEEICEIMKRENENTNHTFYPTHLTQSKHDVERVKNDIAVRRSGVEHDIEVSLCIVEDDLYPTLCGIYVFYDETLQPPKDYVDSSADPVGVAVQCGLAILSSLAILLTKLVRKYLKKRRRRRQQKRNQQQQNKRKRQKLLKRRRGRKSQRRRRYYRRHHRQRKRHIQKENYTTLRWKFQFVER